MNIRETLQATDFSFINLNLVEKAILDSILIVLDNVRSTLRNKQQITSNTKHFKGKSWKY